jgi:flagellar hook protein FlgE
MYSGVSGLRAEGEALGVVGDNIANVNTTGFKGQRVLFEDVLGHSILAGTTTALPGSGVRVADVQQMFTQGALSATGVSTDMALNGDGFFTVKGSIDGITGNFFTRAGEFKVNNDGYIVNTQGLMLQGYKALPDGTYEAAATSIQVPTTSIPAFATENLSIAANLDANAALLPAFDPNDPTATSNFSTSMTVFDSLGNARQLNVYFSRTSTNT